MKVYKLRPIVSTNKNQQVYGITIPGEIALFLKDTFFKVERSGTTIILTSGCSHSITKKDVIDYNFEDCKI